MAFETLVGEVAEVIAKLKERYGELRLAMLRSSSWDPYGHWDLVVSAEGMDTVSRGKTIDIIIELIRKHVSRPNWPMISRISVLKGEDSFVQAMHFKYPEVSGPGAHINIPGLYGMETPEGIVFESHEPKALSLVGR